MIVACLVVAAVWLPLFVYRIQAHEANVDDFLYARGALQLAQSPAAFLSNALNTGATAPLVLVLAAPGARLAGIYGAIAVDLPLLLLLVLGTYLLARNWLGRYGSAVTGAIVGCTHGILSYSLMLNFAIAATAGVVWSLAAYLKSDHLRQRNWSIGFGIALAGLLLARSLAPVYVAPLLVLVVIDVVIDIRRRGNWSGAGAAWAFAAVAVLAGPWWLVSGPTATHYLFNAGYQVSSGYTSNGVGLSLSSIRARLIITFFDFGWLQAWILSVAFCVSFLLIAFLPRLRRMRGIGLVMSWIGLTLLVLSTSSNSGTGFGMPLVAVAIVICCAAIGSAVPSSGGLKAVVVSLVSLAMLATASGLIVGVATETSETVNHWSPSPRYRLDVIGAGGITSANTDELAVKAEQEIGNSDVDMARNDALLNSNGILWEAAQRGATRVRLTGGTAPVDTADAIQELPSSYSVVSGAAFVPYFFINELAVERAAAADGFRPVATFSPSPGLTIDIWRRGTVGIDTPLVEVPTVTSPRGNAVIDSGTQILSGTAIGIVNAMTFTITNLSSLQRVSVVATDGPQGWTARWESPSAGKYSIRAVASDVLGHSRMSPPILVSVTNRR